MPRKPRFFVPGAPVHAVHRRHNRSAVFFDDFDYLEYLCCLKQATDNCSCAVYAYVLMTNHVHLLLMPERANSVGRLFQVLEYVAWMKRSAIRECGAPSFPDSVALHPGYNTLQVREIISTSV